MFIIQFWQWNSIIGSKKNKHALILHYSIRTYTVVIMIKYLTIVGMWKEAEGLNLQGWAFFTIKHLLWTVKYCKCCIMSREGHSQTAEEKNHYLSYPSVNLALCSNFKASSWKQLCFCRNWSKWMEKSFGEKKSHTWNALSLAAGRGDLKIPKGFNMNCMFCGILIRLQALFRHYAYIHRGVNGLNVIMCTFYVPLSLYPRWGETLSSGPGVHICGYLVH